MSGEGRLEDVIDKVLSALANTTRRAIVKALAEGGSMTFAELMRVCNVRDSSTMKHHLAKLGRLVRKLENGSYALTPIGYEAFKLLEQLEESVSRLIPLASSLKPLIIIKPSKRHLLLPAAMATLAVALGITLNPYAAIPPAIGLCITLLYPLISGSKIVLVGRNSITEVRSTILSKKEHRILGRIVGVGTEHNAFLDLLGLTKLTIILSTRGGIRTYVIGYVPKTIAEERTADIERIAKTNEDTKPY